jgi:acyl-CoA thioesterase FadM
VAPLKYRRPARPHDLLTVAIVADSVGPASFSFDYEVSREDGLLLVTGSTRLAVCDRETGRSMPMPSWLRDLFGRVPHAGRDDA